MPKENLRDLIVGAAAAVATPFDENYEVDLGKMYDLTQWWVANGLTKGNGIIKVAAAAGEGPMLDDPEWAALLRTTVQASDGKATVMCGLHYKDTKRTIRDAKVAQDMGAYALQVCPPIFNDPSQDDPSGLLRRPVRRHRHRDHGLPHPLAQGRSHRDRHPPEDGRLRERGGNQVEPPRRAGLRGHGQVRRPIQHHRQHRQPRSLRPARRSRLRPDERGGLSAARPQGLGTHQGQTMGRGRGRCTALCKGRCGSLARRSASVQAAREG